MADNLSTPRITSQYLDEFPNKTVRIIGKVTQLRGETATVDSEGVVTAHLTRVGFPFLCCPECVLNGIYKQDSHLTVGNAVEIVCKVNSDLSVKVLKSTDMGTTLGTFAVFSSLRN